MNDFQYLDMVKVTVTEEEYDPSRLFKKIKHKPEKPIQLKGEGITLCNSDELCEDDSSGKFTLTSDEQYSQASLKEVHVYFNRWDTKQENPLVLVFLFANGSPGNKYYKRSEFKDKLDGGGRAVEISELDHYSIDRTILPVLIDENDKLDELLTYDIGRIEGYVYFLYKYYNKGKIKLEDSHDPDLSSTPFKKFRHKATWSIWSYFGYSNMDHTNKNGCVIYNNEVLLSQGNSEAQDIQGKKYDYINVYFGGKGKANRSSVGSSGSDGQSPTISLLIELKKKEHPSEPEYYVHRPEGGTNNKTYWAKLKDAIGAIFTSIGLSTITGRRGYDTLNGMLRTVRILLTSHVPDLSEKLQGATGYRLKNLLGQQVPQEGLSQKSVLLLLLRRIEFDLTKCLVILMDHKDTNYNETQVKSAVDGLEPKREINRVDMKNGNKYITVTDKTQEVAKCLQEYNYKVYEHNLSNVTKGLDKGQSVGIRFLISRSNPNRTSFDITLYDKSGMELEAQDIQYTYYTRENGDSSNENSKVYALFYDGDSSSVPLLLFYNGKWFKPNSRDDYFIGWVKDEAVPKNLTLPCCIQGESDWNCYLLKVELDIVSSSLNQIDLDPDKVTSKGYGIPIPKGQEPQEEGESYIKRVNVTKKDPDNGIYTRVVHRTTNGLSIGDIYYSGKDITFDGIKVNGGTIKIGAGSNHTSFLGYENKQNTLVAYYSKTDSKYQLPQLIVILQTDEGSIKAGNEPITSTPKTNYGYYILSTGKGGIGYKYTWRTVNEGNGLTLDEATEFKLLNSAVIILDKQSQYQGGEISTAIKRVDPPMTSPGNKQGVNRLIQKMIMVKDITSNGPGINVSCVTRFGYKVYTHDFQAVVTPNLPLDSLPGVTLIAGIRFLVPSDTEDDKYQEVTLCGKDTGYAGSCKPMEYLYHKKNHNRIYVYSYGQDPRPLLICYNGNTYKPRKVNEPKPSKQVDVSYDQWVKVSGISSCVCTVSEIKGNEDLLKGLTDVVGYLNPVQLNPKQVPDAASKKITSTLPQDSTYDLHKYNNQTIKMKLTSQDVGCYKKYIYEPVGTGESFNSGFRLGKVFYSFNIGSSNTTLDYNATTQHRYYPLIRVTVYYYDEDKKFEDPLLVELVFQTSTGAGTPSNKTEYYKLTKREKDEVKWELDKEQKEQLIGEKLVTYLDKIRYLLKQALKIEIHHRGNSYKVQVSENKGGKGAFTPLNNGSKEIQVKEGPICTALSGTGYKCFKHDLTSLTSEEHHKIGGLRFYIPCSKTNKEEEIKLYESGSSGNCDKLTPGTQIKEILYNSCMGDICVYFYGGTSAAQEPSHTGNGNTGNGQESSQESGSTDTGDPRPLLLCYNGNAFRAQSMKEYDCQRWVKMSGSLGGSGSGCPGSDTGDTNGCNKILGELVTVSNFLNAVDIHKVPPTDKKEKKKEKPPPNGTQSCSYNVHKFNGTDIKITVTLTKATSQFCYDKYVHTPAEGHRLGRIDYGSIKEGAKTGEKEDSKCIQENGGNSTCINAVLEEPRGKAADEVAVYYYKGDPKHDRPLLVALCSKTGGATTTSTTVTCKLYYTLKKEGGGNKKYTKGESTPLDINTPTKVEQELDKALRENAKTLQVILSERPKPTLFCPRDEKSTKIFLPYNPECERDKKSDNKLLGAVLDFGVGVLVDVAYGLEKAVNLTLSDTKSSYNEPKPFPCVESCYEERKNKDKFRKPRYTAQIYSNTGSPLSSDSRSIEVTEVPCASVNSKGYKCYRHCISGLDNVEEIGGLRLYLWPASIGVNN